MSNLKKYAAKVLADERNINGEIAIVTGSNSGIGKQTALELATRGAVVIMACRNFEKAENARNDILQSCPQAKLEIEQLDLLDFDSIQEFVNRIKVKYPRVDILVNNGGIFLPSVNYTKDGHELHMRTNHMGAFLLTTLLVDHMKKRRGQVASRIIFISSSMQAFANLHLDDLDMKNGASAGLTGGIPYGNSKLANALISRELARRLQGCGINSYALCPGLVETEIASQVHGLRQMVVQIMFYLGGINLKEGCKTIMHCALSKTLEKETGQFYRFLQKWDPGHKRYNDLFSSRLWDECEKVCKVQGISRKLEELRKLR